MVRRGIPGRISGGRVSEGGTRTVAGVLRKLFARASRRAASGKGVRAAARSECGDHWAHGSDQPAGAAASGDRRLQDGESEANETGGAKLAVKSVCAGGSGRDGTRTGAIGILQFDDE